LKSYQKINNNLTCLCINGAVLDNGGCNVIAETLRWCTNLKSINLGRNNITDEQLLPMIDAIRGHTSLEYLALFENRIGNAGCHALVTLLKHTKTNLQTLYLDENQIDHEGATAIADSLAKNTTLKKLDLIENPTEIDAVGIFCSVLCETSSIDTTYSSNHTLESISVGTQCRASVSTLLEMNKEKNKSHVAIRKILKYHPNIDMKPLFEWGVNEDGEQTLKALPHVVDWFERAKEAVAGDGDREDYHIEERQLSAILQFAKAMPLLLEPISRIKVDDQRNKCDV
jgi:hypothetical protein